MIALDVLGESKTYELSRIRYGGRGLKVPYALVDTVRSPHIVLTNTEAERACLITSIIASSGSAGGVQSHLCDVFEMQVRPNPLPQLRRKLWRGNDEASARAVLLKQLQKGDRL